MTFGIGSKPVAKSGDSSKYYLTDLPSLLCSEERMIYAVKVRRESERKMMQQNVAK